MKFVITLLLFSLPVNVFANTYPGISIGINFPWISGNDVETEFRSIAYGLNLGGQLEFTISNKVSFNPSLVYSVKGARWKYDRNDGSSASDWSRARYLELPLDFKFEFLQNKKLSPFIKTGIVPAFFLGATKKISVSGDTVLKASYNVAAREYDLGINIGGGIAIPFKNDHIILSSIFTFDFFSVDKTDDMSIKNRAVSIIIGYLFRKGKSNE